jgi:hypothetical protein
VDLEEEAEEKNLLANIAKQLPDLEELLEEASGHWGYEDPIYRFYHQSFKVFALQEQTQRIVEALRGLAPHLPLNPWFTQIVSEGTGHQFAPEMNQRWLEATRPILEAFFHARYFLEMVCRYGRELAEPPIPLPSGWAAVLYVYGLRYPH